ncbi:DHA2 family efflux MFS transporter permease subunit [Pseudonocardia acaciae]|uniref:DHA2 family efflux MFS transporter permease subunit n=1 Tax=Pseudonocardia acaciae TaxID=551276 RepID=UPI0007E8CF24|nr:DHA2 family efflux MFS transporter permease subunit [Pseudonocardia acaciae]
MAGVRPGPDAGGTEAQPVRWGLPLAVLIAGMFMSILDVSIVNVAIPTIQKDFGTTTDDVQWVATAYTLALGVVVPLSGWLGDRFGMRRVYTLSVLGFAAGSALCGVAWSLDSLVAFRIVQAIPGGIVPVVTMSMVYLIVPREKIGTAMGMYGLGVVFAPAVGPTLGGYLVEYVDWRLIFFINVPIGVLGAIAAALVLPKIGDGRGGRLDVWGFVTISSGLFALLLALSEGQDWGWNSYRVLMLLTYSALSLALFVVIELEVDQPLLDVRMFRYWQFTNSLVLIGLMSVALFAVLFYIPLLLQQGQNLGAFETGLLLLPQALVMGVMMPIAGRLYDLIGPRWPAMIGLGIVAVGTYLLHDLTLDASREHIMWLLAFRAVGMGLAMMPIMTGGMAAVPQRLVSRASAFNNVVQRCVAALGLAVLTAVLTRQQAQQLADRSALVPTTVTPPTVGAPGAPPTAGLYAMFQQTRLRVFVAAMDDLFLITAAISALGVIGALFLRSELAKALAGRAQSPAAQPEESKEPRPARPGPVGSRA